MDEKKSFNFFHIFDPVKDSLWFAARRGDIKSVKSILEQGHHPDGEGQLNPLCGATDEGHIEVMKVLLDGGADVNKPGVTGLTAINFALTNAEAMAILLQHGADIGGLSLERISTRCKKDIVDLLTDIFDPVKDSLWFATRRGDAKSVESLLKQGHDPDGEGRLNPLCGATYEGHVKIVSLLLEGGADANKLGIYGLPAINYALNNTEVLGLLLQYGADISGLDMEHISKTKSNDIVELLTGASSSKNFTQSHYLNAINIKWSENEIQALVESVTSRVLFMGEYMVGKTSLVRKLVNRNSKLTKPEERTVVAEFSHWVVDEGQNKVVSLVDLGGHRSYQSSGHYFHCNSVNNTAVTCHDIISDDFYQTFTWIKSVLTRSPKCNVLLVLTKCDQIDKKAIAAKLTMFLQAMKKLILEEIKSLDDSIAILKRRKCKQLPWFCELRGKYKWLANKLPEITMVTSCTNGYESSIDLLIDQIMNVSDDGANRIKLPEHYQKFYIALGKLGVRLPKSKLHSSSDQTCLKKTNKKQNESNNNGNLTKSMDNIVSEIKSIDNELDKVSLTNVTNIAPLQYVYFEDALQIYKDILRKYHIVPKNIDKSLTECLECLHQHGLLMYFTGNKELEQIIFNDMKSFVDILQCIFHHETTDGLKFSDIAADLKCDVYNTNEQTFLNDMKVFHKQGLLSYPLLNVLLANNNCDIDPKVVMQLLALLEIGFLFTPENSQIEHLFIPYHVNGKEMPEFLKEELKGIHLCDRDTISVKGYISGNLPDTFWNYVLVRLFKHQHTRMQSKYAWKNGFWATLGKQNVRILLTYNGKNQIDFTVKGRIKDIAGHNLVWNLIEYIDNECDRLSLHWWPGLVTKKIIICTHCGLMNLQNPSEWCLSQIFSHAFSLTDNDEETFSCEENPRYNPPLGVIMPLPEETSLAKKICDAAREYINDNIALCGSLDTEEDFDSVESVFHHIADNLPHKYFHEVARCLGFTTVQIDDMECYFTNRNRPPRDLRYALLESFQHKQSNFDLHQIADSIRAAGELDILAQHVRSAADKLKEVQEKRN